MWLTVNEQDSQPIYQQIVSQVRAQVGRGTLRPGDELPSVRELAESLGVNMHTVRAAYLKLRDQGLISLRLGRRARVAVQPQLRLEQNWQARLVEAVTDARLAGASPADIRHAVAAELDARPQGKE